MASFLNRKPKPHFYAVVISFLVVYWVYFWVAGPVSNVRFFGFFFICAYAPMRYCFWVPLNQCNKGGVILCVSSNPFKSVTNGKEKFSRLFCRLKSDCRRPLALKVYVFWRAQPRTPASVMLKHLNPHKNTKTSALLFIYLLVFHLTSLTVRASVYLYVIW